MTDSAHEKSILFLCVANAARSQMAEGLARTLLPDDWRIASAGSEPGTLDPRAVTVMQEIGIDISDQYSKSIDSLDLTSYHWIITLCQEEVCPIVSGQFERKHWPSPDPARHESDDLDGFRETREAIKTMLKTQFREHLEGT
ncbi:arsenate reductase [Natronospira proteinivora]|uniref:Arsenate reductase n=1 Tax=Natronospira proteinivora TaxID=1807133 RepID=A0ABT1G940_9GAMM|nr:arsenate reductase ArsC [Natronospira proteinivora]MCP1727420.1 arsenate reductase [Natronospira proteinivora]